MTPGSALTVLDAQRHGARSGVRAVDGVITEMGPGVVARPGDEVIDARGMHLVESLVNGHTHAAMTLLRSYGDDLPLMVWLQTRIWPAEGRLEPADSYWGTRLACLEMIRSGTTHFVDMYWHAPEVARAVEDAGLRATVCTPLFDGGVAKGMAALEDDALESLELLAPFSKRITPCLGPHSVYAVSEASLQWVGATAIERGVGIHMHLAETRREVEDCVSTTGSRPLELADRCGLLSPSTVLAHGCWLEPDELTVVAERGATIVANPVSNLKLAVGRIFPYLEAAATGVSLGLGTDGPASNNSLDMFGEMKMFALTQKFVTDDAATLPAAETWAIATGQRSPLLGGTRLAPGGPADFLLVRGDLPEVATGAFEANLVYSATGAVVDTTVVAGRVLMQGREVAGADEVVAEARTRAARLTGTS